MQYIDFPIGTIIKHEHKLYEVVESDSCNNCAFWDEHCNKCRATGEVLSWSCCRFARDDFKNVIFRFVGWALLS